jgi:hypothetical protein
VRPTAWQANISDWRISARRWRSWDSQTPAIGPIALVDINRSSERWLIIHVGLALAVPAVASGPTFLAAGAITAEAAQARLGVAAVFGFAGIVQVLRWRVQGIERGDQPFDRALDPLAELVVDRPAVGLSVARSWWSPWRRPSDALRREQRLNDIGGMLEKHR